VPGQADLYAPSMATPVAASALRSPVTDRGDLGHRHCRGEGDHQLGGQGVQVRGAGQDQPFLGLLQGLLQVFGGDRLGRGDPELVDDLVGERVDQPGLPGGQFHCPVQGLRGELLAGLGGALAVQLPYLSRGEVPSRSDSSLMLTGLAVPSRDGSPPAAAL
jgi:hypothetical protein